MSSDPNYEWEHLLDIDDSDLPLTPILCPCNIHVRETTTTTTTQNPAVDNLEEKSVRIIPGPAGIVQLAKLRKQSDIHEGGDESVLLTQEYIKKVVEGVGEDGDFESGSWVSATEYVNANGGIVSRCLRDIKNFLKNGKLEQVVAIIKSCTQNALGTLTVTMKDISSTIPGGSEMLMEEEAIVKLMKEEEMADLEFHVCGNVIDQEDLYKFDEEALNLVLEEEARKARADQEWLEKCR
ncbi:ribonuclease H-like domain-containing protein [Tanacetum coccineum]